MKTIKYPNIRVILTGLLLIIVGFPVEAHHSSKHYTNKVKSREHYAATNRVNANNPVRYRNYRPVRTRVVHRPAVRPVRNTRVIRTIPRNAIQFRGRNHNFYYSCGNFYQQTNIGYSNAALPLGAVINVLPRRAQEVWYRGQVLYQLDNFFLEAQIDRRGRVFYRIVGFA